MVMHRFQIKNIFAFILTLVFAASSVLSLQAQAVRTGTPQRTAPGSQVDDDSVNLSVLQFGRGIRKAAPQSEEAQFDASSLIKPAFNGFLAKRPQQGNWSSGAGRKQF